MESEDDVEYKVKFITQNRPMPVDRRLVSLKIKSGPCTPAKRTER